MKQDYYLTYLYKNNRKGAINSFLSYRKAAWDPSRAKGNSQGDLISWAVLTLSLPRAILCKGTSCTDKGREATEDVVIPKTLWWNTWMLNNSWRPAQEQEAAAERELWDRRLETLSWAHDTNSHFLPSQRIFSLTNPFLWNMMRASMNSLGQDRPWNNDEIIIEFIVLVQSFLYILRVTEQDCMVQSWLIYF